MLRKYRCIFCLMIIVSTYFCIGCESNSVANRESEPKFSELNCSLGWLGATAKPLARPGSIIDPDNIDKRLTHGGLLLTEVSPNGPLDEAGLVSGDIVAQVEEEWLPIKENPARDMMAIIETQISAEKNEISIGYLHKGEFKKTEFQTNRTSLDENLPSAPSQIVDEVDAALQKLAEAQQDDGSFGGGTSDVQAKLVATSMAGLALLSAHDSYVEKYVGHVEKCLQFIAAQFADEMPNHLEPLTCAYIAQFLAESEIDLLEENWLDVVAFLEDKFRATQLSTGAWSSNTENNELENEELHPSNPYHAVIIETHITNQVLLAIGAWERKGFEFDIRLARKGCAFLNLAGKNRIPSKMDRRTKAVLSAGTAAALLALNCNPGNSELLRYLDDALSRARDMNSAPSLSLQGLFHCGTVARQTDTPSWLKFHGQTRYLATCLFESDGTIALDPSWQLEMPELAALIDSDIWRSSHWIMIRSLYWQPLRRISGIDRTDQIELRDHLAKKFEVAQPTEMSDQAKKDAEELTKMIIQQLKDRGMDVDEEKLKMKKSSTESGNKADDGS